MWVLNKLVQNITVDETIHHIHPMEILKLVFQQQFCLNKNSYELFKISLSFFETVFIYTFCIHFNVFF